MYDRFRGCVLGPFIYLIEGFFFFLIGKYRNILEKGTLRLTQKHTGEGVYKRHLKAQTKEEKIQNHPSTSAKPIKKTE